MKGNDENVIRVDYFSTETEPTITLYRTLLQDMLLPQPEYLLSNFWKYGIFSSSQPIEK